MKQRFNFIGNTNRFFVISGIVFAVVLVFLVIFRVNLDIQFKGGSIVTYSYQGEIAAADFGSTVSGVLEGASVQQSSDAATGSSTLVVTYAGSIGAETMTALNDAVYAAFPDRSLTNLSINNVDPVIGGEFLAKCLTAVAVASVLMLLYVAWRFRRIGGLSAGAMAVVALIHDILVVFGVFVIFRLPINDNFIAVVLTILGYSLNDTIVIYDRVRENRRAMGELSLGDTVNLSLNQSFARTIMTSVTTVLAMVVVTAVAYFNNVSSILTFSFPMIIGLISGSYSSICIAGPLWVKWRNYQDSKAAAAR
jgi:preprotein translocase SecF subunit